MNGIWYVAAAIISFAVFSLWWWNRKQKEYEAEHERHMKVRAFIRKFECDGCDHDYVADHTVEPLDSVPFYEPVVCTLCGAKSARRVKR